MHFTSAFDSSTLRHAPLTEWLGTALQKLEAQFDPATVLHWGVGNGSQLGLEPG